MNVKKMTELDLKGKKVLIREDLNVPMKDGRISNDSRIRAALPTIEKALQAGAGVLLMSHLGRPTEGESDPALSLSPVAERLSELLGKPVRFEKDYLDRKVEAVPGEVTLLENVRFNKGEKKDDPELGKKLASLCDVYVMDAFATAHRAEASTSAAARFAPVACAGPLLVAELESLGKVLQSPRRPLLAIIGGAKVSTKLSLLRNLVGMVDAMILGGGIANTFLKAAGFPIGKSLCDNDLLDDAAEILKLAKEKNCPVPLPVDVVIGSELSESADPKIKDIHDVGDDDMILDIGPKTAAAYTKIIGEAATIVWNGPVGAFEVNQFSKGTESISRAIAASPAFSIVGGGDTVAAVEKYGVADKMGYISTAGGAFLEFLEGRSLPAVTALEERNA